MRHREVIVGRGTGGHLVEERVRVQETHALLGAFLRHVVQDLVLVSVLAEDAGVAGGVQRDGTGLVILPTPECPLDDQVVAGVALQVLSPPRANDRGVLCKDKNI